MLSSETNDANKSLAYLAEISKIPSYSETKSAIAKLIERKLLPNYKMNLIVQHFHHN